MKMLKAIPVASVLSVVMLTGCGGGGGTKAVVKTVPFSAFSAITPNTRVQAQAEAVETAYTSSTSAPYPVTGATDLGLDSSAQSSFTYDAGGNLTAVTIQTANGSVTWRSSVDTWAYDSGVLQVISADESQYGLVIEPAALGWDYQTFGSWLTGLGDGLGRSGAISLGSRTPDAAIPTTGNATFLGMFSGTYIDATGTGFLVVGNSSLIADFNARTLNFSTFNNATISLVDGNDAVNPALDVAGTLSYAPGINRFSGTVNTTTMTGSAQGYFYGPSAQEVGGTFMLNGAGVERYQGAFGAGR